MRLGNINNIAKWRLNIGLFYKQNMSNLENNAYFQKQRDLLLQEISSSMDSVVYNLDVLNRSLSTSIQVGKEFDDVGRLWSNFYDGLNQYKQNKGPYEGKQNEGERESAKELLSEEEIEDQNQSS